MITRLFLVLICLVFNTVIVERAISTDSTFLEEQKNNNFINKEKNNLTEVKDKNINASGNEKGDGEIGKLFLGSFVGLLGIFLVYILYYRPLLVIKRMELLRKDEIIELQKKDLELKERELDFKMRDNDEK